MPAAAAAGAASDYRERLRRFHLSAEGADDGGGSITPAALLPFFDAGQALDVFPMVVDENDELGTPFAARVTAALTAMGSSVLSEHGARLVWAFGRALGDARAPVPLAGLVARACDAFVADFEVSAEAERALLAAIARFKEALNQSGSLVGLGPHTPFELYRAILGRSRSVRLADFVGETRALATKLGDVLVVDDSLDPSARAADSVATALGSAGEEFFDPTALAARMPKPKGSTRLDPARRKRIESTLEVLRAWLDSKPSASDLVVVHAEAMKDRSDEAGLKLVANDDVLATATALFDAEMSQIAEVVRAVRTARLDVTGDYVAEVHDAQLARLDWQGLTAEELLVATPVAIVEAPSRLTGASLASFSTLLRSGRPIHVLLTDDERMPRDDRFGDHSFELGHFVIAHREAFALQTTLAAPGHLVDGLTEMASSVGTAIAVVATPDPSRGVPPWLELRASLEGRALPIFRYDPAAGPSWAHRFEVSDNPQAERVWPTHDLAYIDASGAEQSLPLAFTFADAAALMPSLRRHFWVLPVEAWDDEQLPLDELVEASENAPALGLPFVWVVTDEGVLARAVVTRELMMAARDRARAFRTLQELGGLNNEHVRRAVEEATEAAAARARADR
jgi:hypothetical protein